MKAFRDLILLPANDTTDISLMRPSPEKRVSRGGSLRKIGKNLAQITNHKAIIRAVYAGGNLVKADDANFDFETKSPRCERHLKSGCPQNALRIAAGRGKPRELLKILLKDALLNINETDSGGRTALHYAAQGGQERCLQLLIDCGANVNVLDHYGISPLYYSVLAGHYESASMLIDAGAEVKSIQDGLHMDIFQTKDRKINMAEIPADENGERSSVFHSNKAVSLENNGKEQRGLLHRRSSHEEAKQPSFDIIEHALKRRRSYLGHILRRDEKLCCETLFAGTFP